MAIRNTGRRCAGCYDRRAAPGVAKTQPFLINFDVSTAEFSEEPLVRRECSRLALRRGVLSRTAVLDLLNSETDAAVNWKDLAAGRYLVDRLSRGGLPASVAELIPRPGKANLE